MLIQWAMPPKRLEQPDLPRKNIFLKSLGFRGFLHLEQTNCEKVDWSLARNLAILSLSNCETTSEIMSHQEPIQQKAEQGHASSGKSSLTSSGGGASLNPPPFQLKASGEGGGSETPAQMKAAGGMPQNLVDGFSQSTGHDLSDVNVHYNSDKPKDVGALAYAQGNDIHLGAGQEKHLAHEAGHIVQQREGRVKPTTEVGGMPVNDNKGLESEADSLGDKAMQMKSDSGSGGMKMSSTSENAAIQKQVDPNAPLQRRAEMDFSKTNLTATLRCEIYIYGSGASDEKAASMQKFIMSDWNQGWTYDDPDGDTYDVIFDVNVQVFNGEDPESGPNFMQRIGNMFGTSNYIKVGADATEVDRSFVRGGYKGEWRGYGSDPSSHEFGHLIGLDDQYTDEGGANAGWEGNVMSEPAEVGVVEQRNIDGIMSNMLPRYKRSRNYKKGKNLTLNLNESRPSW